MAVNIVCEFNLKVVGFSVHPLVKLKLIHPPSPAVMLIPINPSSSAISKTSFCEAEVSDDSKSSLVQLIINSNDINKKILLIVKFIKLTRKKYEIT